VTAPLTGGRHREIVGRHRALRRRGRRAVLAAGGAVLAVGGVLALWLPSSTAASGVPVPVSLVAGEEERDDALPTRVRVPAIEVDSALLRLGIDENRSLVPPSDFARAGWFAGGPAPGRTGPAVIAGHVDSYAGPAVFFRLADLERGDEVLVDRADGTTVRFTVTTVERYPKDEFPTDTVYGPTPRAELRLITCGGEFDAGARSYRDNVVVSAVLSS
jgi:sortase (surface protein transpeptidase)